MALFIFISKAIRSGRVKSLVYVEALSGRFEVFKRLLLMSVTVLGCRRIYVLFTEVTKGGSIFKALRSIVDSCSMTTMESVGAEKHLVKEAEIEGCS